MHISHLNELQENLVETHLFFFFFLYPSFKLCNIKYILLQIIVETHYKMGHIPYPLMSWGLHK